jgi:hypothetical protein
VIRLDPLDTKGLEIASAFAPGRWYLGINKRGRLHFFPETDHPLGGIAGGILIRGAITSCGRIAQTTFLFTAPEGGPWKRCAACVKARKGGAA